jgi:hypothetical protein
MWCEPWAVTAIVVLVVIAGELINDRTRHVDEVRAEGAARAERAARRHLELIKDATAAPRNVRVRGRGGGCGLRGCGLRGCG